MAASEREELAGIAFDLRAHLEWLRDSGVREVPTVAPAASVASASAGAPSSAEPVSLRAAVRQSVGAPAPRMPARAAPAPTAVPAPAAAPTASAAEAALPARRLLEEVRAELGDCTRCRLATTRKHLVFGVGSQQAQLVFVGEGPGAEEDRQGIPFVGAAGELLTKMIEAMGFGRDEVYICNVVKCRPPGNRNPEPDEIEACEPFLRAQLASLQPKVIVALGKFAAQTLLREQTSITRLRGNWRQYCGIQLMPTFHPAYLLRQPGDKKLVWADLQKVMKVFGKEPPARK